MSITTTTTTSAAPRPKSSVADAPEAHGAEIAQLRADLAKANAQVETYRDAFVAISEVCRAGSEGDLEPRLPALGEEQLLQEVRAQLNHLLDLTDAFVREAGASLEYASDGRYFRRFLVRGMKGSFRLGAGIINNANGAMAAADARLGEAAEARKKLASDFEDAVMSVARQVAAAATEMEATSRSLAGTAEHTAGRASDAASGSVEASAGVSSVAAAVEELAGTVGEIERQATESNEGGRSAAEQAGRALETMRTLEQASLAIGQVVTVINQVSSQTRLLALNATIEAARAGDLGKGFAVVASEVKDLAAQTGQSTELIARQVEEIQAVTARAVAAIDGVAQTVQQMSEGAETIAKSVGEQRLATAEISRNTHMVATATEGVSRSIDEVTSGTSETNEAAGQMTAAAADLSILAETLRSEVDGFLVQIAEQ